jgi:hypothetical protein
MGFRQASMVLAGMLAAALAARAQSTAVSVLDDFEAGSNQNKFLGYSFFYADAADGGNSVISSAKPGATATELLVDSAKSFDAGYNSTKSLKLDFTFGSTKPSSGGTKYGNMVGFGTQFLPGTDDASGKATTKTLDLTGATAITFWAKASVAMDMRVEITTTDVKDFAYHRAVAHLTTTWAKQTVLLTSGLGGINQPTWTQTPVTFNPANVQKLQCSISADDNAALTGGTVWIDSIAVVGYKWVPPNACVKCVSTTAATGAVLSDLETSATHAGAQNAAGGYWYAYNDVGTRTVTSQSQYSEIFEGVDATDPTAPILKVSPAKGAAGSAGAYIKFTLGPSYSENGSQVMPFVGIGTKTSDALGTAFLDATPSTGIAFDYWTDAASTFSFIRLEVKTNQTDIGANAGAVHSVLVPTTGGTWMTANIPWATFSLPNWKDIPDPTVKVKTSGIAKFQWAVQDAPGTTGAFAIDNVKLPGMTTIPVVSIRSVQQASSKDLRMVQANGRLNVAFDMPAGVTEAQVNLLDMKGAVVATHDLSGKGLQQASLETRSLNSGIYSLQVRHGNVVRAMPVTLLK